jgi:hypothetical protein
VPWSDCEYLAFDPRDGASGVMGGVGHTAVPTVAFPAWACLDGSSFPCRLQADFTGHERILGRDALNRLDVRTYCSGVRPAKSSSTRDRDRSKPRFPSRARRRRASAPHPRALRSAARMRSGVIGCRVSRTPRGASASFTALTMAPGRRPCPPLRSP